MMGYETPPPPRGHPPTEPLSFQRQLDTLKERVLRIAENAATRNEEIETLKQRVASLETDMANMVDKERDLSTALGVLNLLLILGLIYYGK